MADDSDDRNLVIFDDDAAPSAMARWVPMVVVLGVFGGFIALSWYAYHAGMQSVKDEDLVVVEADKTPMKEKPADPGGMKFPNQDKTIFDTFAGNAQQQPKVERVLPVPEEPIVTKGDDTSNTGSWINDKSHKPDGAKDGKPEQVIGKDDTSTDTKAVVKIPPVPADRQLITAAQSDDQSETYVAGKEPVKPGQALDNAVKNTAKPAAAAPEKAPEKAKEVKKTGDKPAPAATPTGNFMIQLGAYRSEKEANDAWTKLHVKYAEVSDKSPLVVKADLGEKGIYYRLRASGFASATDAKKACAALSAKGQACLLPAGK